MGSIITFYSYKGGVGRSMALANIGVILANWGKKTLLIDWDLEAPGLENYFKTILKDYKGIIDNPGLIDILDERANNASFKSTSVLWKNYLIPIQLENNSNLYLITSGKKDDHYVNKVRNLDFSVFYNENDGGDFLEEIRTYWKKNFDFVLIDSRTGLTDSSGICSIHMPDVLLILFTATEQGFEGTLNVFKKSKQKHEELIYDRLKLTALPIATRFDNSELKLTEEWLNKFATDLNEVYTDFIPEDKDGNLMIQPLDILKKTKVPYISFFSYGEKLPILEQGSDDPNSIGYVYETITAIIANNFKDIYKLKEERDSYIKIGKGEDILDYTYYQKQIEKGQEEKKKLEEELKIRDEKIQDQIAKEQEAKKKLEEELRIKDEKIQRQLKKSRQIQYVIFALIGLAVLIFIISKIGSGNRDQNRTTSTGSDTMAKDTTMDIASVKDTTTSIANNYDYKLGLRLIVKSDCSTCHKISEKLTGPSYQDVANKYAGSATAVNYLVNKIIRGGKGVWGIVPMTPHPLLAEADAAQMVKYILLLKSK